MRLRFVGRPRFTRRADIHSIAPTVWAEAEGTVVNPPVRPDVRALHPSSRRTLLPTPNSCPTD
ncbi:hypothetical protein BDM02DRAFT_3273156 [Thelephora ganbajun]|uniref:Uncharacterized protein n=1 Tax=Thelephora ganbajun TaxID=370292 RepID=A0ACB6Z0K3_THEGA|nr:hypothetical protein BDM02DRAFT_3273156 [Thelephora ganbajun]